MLIDYENIHRTYLIGRHVGDDWEYEPTHARDPRKGMIVSSHTAFSNNALQLSIHLYNRVNERGRCIGVSHCLLLCFSHKVGGSYRLNNDENRITFHLDLGVAAELYSVAVGHAGQCSYRAVRKGRAVKSIEGEEAIRNGRRIVTIRATGGGEGRSSSIEIDLGKADLIALAAHCVGYARVLYPSLSDTAIQELLSATSPNSRACAENQDAPTEVPRPTGGEMRADHQRTSGASSVNFDKLRRTIWAIGNQKWESMRLDALQRIQQLDDASLLQELINEAHAQDFTRWDAYLL